MDSLVKNYICLFNTLIVKYTLYILLAIFLSGFYYLFVRSPVISGYTAKCVCTQYFENGRPLDDIASDDFDLLLLSIARLSIDDKEKSITSSVLGMRSRTAIYKQGLGCQLLQGKDDHHIKLFDTIDIVLNDTIDFPYGNRIPSTIPSNVNSVKLAAVAKKAFDKGKEMIKLKTRSLLIVYKDTIILDVNQDGFTYDTPQLGWSMTKSWMNTLVGMKVLDGQMDITNDQLFDHWTDDRSKITLHHLLTMTSGIDWQEDYSNISDATEMLYMSEDIVSAANDNPIKYPPGSHWYYSSGTSNMISGLLRAEFDTIEDYLDYPYTAMFNKLGMSQSFMEIDESGNYIGSSYGYGSTKDWARFGLLYLHDGIWNGERVLPHGWVDYSTTEVVSSDGKYGAHFWLNKRGVAFSDAPFDTYSANGYNGQKTIIIPSKDLVIVRLGLNSDFDFNGLIQSVINAIDFDE